MNFLRDLLHGKLSLFNKGISVFPFNPYAFICPFPPCCFPYSEGQTMMNESGDNRHFWVFLFFHFILFFYFKGNATNVPH